MSDPTSPAAVKVALVDIDGTLLDSNHAHALAWVEVLRRHGHEQPYDKLRTAIGKGGDKVLGELVGIDDEGEEGQRISKERREIFAKEHLPSLQPTHGARALLERLQAENIRVVIATSAGGDELKGLLRQAGVEDLIDTAASSSDAEQSKPDPDIVTAALKKAGVEATEAVMLGDTPYDIQAARAAGVGTIALRSGGWWDDAALEGALAIYTDPAELLERFEQSPFRATGTALA
jgi:HAD superfamily hydrolase (TIGR01549 family)